MFERYTEKARRTIFFARYEAAQLGSPFIETEHLLLGLLREEQSNFHALIGKTTPDFLRRIREQIEAEKVSHSPAPTNVDVPLSNESKRVLAYAAEEAERLQHRHIGTEHLLLGLMREQKSAAARILGQFGLTSEAARTYAQNASTGPEVNRVPNVRFGPEGVVYVHGGALDAARVRNTATELRRFAWVKQEWQPYDLLVEKGTGRVMFYSGQPFDTARFDIAKAAWSRDHCAICRWELCRDAGPEHQTGYANGRQWVCTQCFEQFVLINPSPADDIYT